MCCRCINCSACCLATQQLVFWTPSYLHRLCCFHSINMLWVAAPNLLKGILEERVSLAKMVGDGTESTICIAAVDAIVLSSLWHRSLLQILLLCCRVSFHDSNKAPEHLLHSIAVHLIISYRARSRLADHIWSQGTARALSAPRHLRGTDLQGSFFAGGWFGCDSPVRLPPDDTLLEAGVEVDQLGQLGQLLQCPEMISASRNVMAPGMCFLPRARTTPCCEQRSAQRLSQPPRYGSQTGWKGERKGITWVFPWDFPGRIAPPAFGMLSAFPSRPSQMAEVCWSSEW